MTNPVTRFPFIDSVHAAELLHVSQETILDWVREGKLSAYGGKPTNPFLRSTNVTALAEKLGVSPEDVPRRVKSTSARVQQRITADARWSDIAIDDIREWVGRADSSRRQAARTAAVTARHRLDALLVALDEADSD